MTDTPNQALIKTDEKYHQCILCGEYKCFDCVKSKPELFFLYFKEMLEVLSHKGSLDDENDEYFYPKLFIRKDVDIFGYDVLSHVPIENLFFD